MSSHYLKSIGAWRGLRDRAEHTLVDPMAHRPGLLRQPQPVVPLQKKHSEPARRISTWSSRRIQQAVSGMSVCTCC